MFRNPIVGCVVLAGLACRLVGASPERVKPFSHYQSIIDRLPFGEMSSAATLAEAAGRKGGGEEQLKPDQQQLARQVSMSGITVMPDGGLAVGFCDRGVNPPAFHFLRVGAPADASGWEALKASYEKEWVTLRKDGVELTVQLGKGAIEGPPKETNAPAATVQAPQAPAPARRPRRRPEASAAAPKGIQEAIASARERAEGLRQAREAGESPRDYLARLRKRTAEQENALKAAEAAVKKQQDDQQAAAEKAKAAAERRIDIELIKQGGRPRKNIDLTKEEEKELIEAGVLSE